MKLDVIPPTADDKVWYEQGLRFTCTTCGNCCTGGPGFVWLADDEVDRLAGHLGIGREDMLRRYCREVSGRISLREKRGVGGTYDCVFLTEVKPPRTSRSGEAIVQAKRVCGVYPARPLQCRTWPFWPENLDSPEAWQVETRKCPGMNTGRHYTRRQVEGVRDAADWPTDGPSS